MHRVRRSERCPGANTAVNTAADTGAWRSNQTTRKRSDTGYYDADPESGRASGNTTNESDYSAWNRTDTPNYNARDTDNESDHCARGRSGSISDAAAR